MKRILIEAGLGLMAASGASQHAQSPDPAFVQEATQLAVTYLAKLQAELSAAIKQVGPVGAIGACQSAAPAIAADLSSRGDRAGSRIARRNRNPDNAVPAELDAFYQELERAHGDAVRFGEQLMTDTATHETQDVGIGLVCSNCHLEAGRKAAALAALALFASCVTGIRSLLFAQEMAASDSSKRTIPPAMKKSCQKS
ncbi:MAG: hypothetical protein ACKO01_10005 [Erythrobacter sp.]